MGQQLVLDPDVLEFELGGKKVGQALGQFEQGLVQGPVLAAVELEAAENGRALAQGHDNGLAQGTVRRGAADTFAVAHEQGQAAVEGPPGGLGPPGLAGQVMVGAGAHMATTCSWASARRKSRGRIRCRSTWISRPDLKARSRWMSIQEGWRLSRSKVQMFSSSAGSDSFMTRLLALGRGKCKCSLPLYLTDL